MADGGTARKLTLAQQADRHDLYEKSVQNPESECEFIANTFRKIRRRKPLVLREDFCGTAGVACEWVRQGPGRRAIGVDLDPSVLAWGIAHNVARLSPARRKRVELIEDDVLKVRTGPVDAVAAFNFSYWIFKTRAELVRYFRRVRTALVSDGVFFLDAYGGYDAYRELEEATVHDGFTYIWNQETYYPVTGEMSCRIDFRFPDGSRLKRAFTYDWRLWSLPELQEILAEAGFARSSVWWEGTGEDGEGNGEFSPEARGEADAGWIAYIVAER